MLHGSIGGEPPRQQVALAIGIAAAFAAHVPRGECRLIVARVGVCRQGERPLHRTPRRLPARLAPSGDDDIGLTDARQRGAHERIDRLAHVGAVALQAVGAPRQVERHQQR
ncbi:MAG TPA: hypothetical protein PLG77_12560, partial [Burkholderiaceae bacterium]|nr:hypothetical protein [Burkholderiaceae bacterium]